MIGTVKVRTKIYIDTLDGLIEAHPGDAILVVEGGDSYLARKEGGGVLLRDGILRAPRESALTDV